MIPSGYSRNSFHGRLPGGEIFGWSLWTNEAPITVEATQTQANAFRDAFVAADSSVYAPHHLLSADSSYTGVTTYSYTDASGKAAHIAEAPMNIAGVNAGALLPNQCSVVVSLKTALAGRRHQGRVYLPMTEFSLGAGGELDIGFAGGLAGYFATLIGALNSAIGGPAKVVVLSQVAGTSQPVTATRCDTRVDIQRRRANRQTVQASVLYPVV